MIDTKRMWALWVIITVIGVPGIALAVPKGPAVRHANRPAQPR